MSEVDRPNYRSIANEETQAAARASENRRLRNHGQNRESQAAQSQTAASQTPVRSREQKAFEEVLRSASDKTNDAIAKNASTEAGVEEIRQENKNKNRDDDSSDKKKDKDKTDTKRDGEAGGPRSVQDTKGRVLAKRSTGEKKQDSSQGDGQKRETFQGARRIRKAFAEETKKKKEVTAGDEMLMQKLQETQLQAASMRELPKALLDQIIQHIAILQKSKELEKEMHIDFRDNFFNGLKMRVRVKGKEVSIEFIVPNRDVELCFKGEKDNLACHLGKEGFDVRSITISRG